MTYDMVVVGGGPGGYAAALRAAGHGLRVAIVEADRVGGTCLHRGCVPSKALLHVAALADRAAELEALGLATGTGPVDVGAAGRFRDGVVDQLHRGLEGLLRSRSVDVVRGWGRLCSPTEVEVTGEAAEPRCLTAGHVVVATGSLPVDGPGVEPDGTHVLRSDDALALGRVPASAVVVGAGAVGVEVASLWRSLGASVAIVEGSERLLPLEDPDTSAALERAFRRRGIEVRTGVALADVRVDVGAGSATVALDDGTTLAVEQVLVAVGRRPATSGTGLAELGLLDERGFVAVDGLGRTVVPTVWAVGDSVATLALAHAAFAEGFTVADAIAGLDPAPVDHAQIPRVTYCSPEVASVGLTEPEAQAAHDGVTATVVPVHGNARALIEGGGGGPAGVGQVKLVCAADGTLLGGHVVGPAATELIAGLASAVAWGALASELGEVVHPHPTLAEGIREAALAAGGTPFHASRRG